MSKNMNKIIQGLSDRDKNALFSIYTFRCLTLEQIYTLHYSKSLKDETKIVSDVYCKKKISEMVAYNILERVDYLDIEAYFLTNFGVDVVRQCFDLPNNLFDVNRKVVERGYYRAFELKISEKNIKHQIYTNQFLIDFQLMYQETKSEFNWKYFDEKYISQFANIRPDGLLSMFNIDFFVEMDMSTESKAQLNEKWSNYRGFLNSSEYKFSERKIVVLFIVDGSSDLKSRIDLIKYTLSSSLLDKIGNNFEIYVDTSENLLNLIYRKYIMENITGNKIKSILEGKHNFTLDNTFHIKRLFNDIEYQFYCRKKNNEGRILVENGLIQEFVVDDYVNCPVSVISKIAFLKRNSIYFNSRLKRDLNYVVVANSIEEIYNDLIISDLLGVDNVYFTTIELLESDKFYESLINIDYLGNIYGFLNNGLSERVFIKNMNE